VEAESRNAISEIGETWISKRHNKLRNCKFAYIFNPLLSIGMRESQDFSSAIHAQARSFYKVGANK
jgi:hypothetical protein